MQFDSKKQTIQTFTELISGKDFVIVKLNSLSARESHYLRKNLRPKQCNLRMIKNTFAKHVFKQLNIYNEQLESLLFGENAFLVANNGIEALGSLNGLSNLIQKKLSIVYLGTKTKSYYNNANNLRNAINIGSINNLIFQIVECIQTPVIQIIKLIDTKIQKEKK